MLGPVLDSSGYRNTTSVLSSQKNMEGDVKNILVNTGDMSDSVLNYMKVSFRELFLIRK